jgi:hypothetical protein
MQRPKVFFVGLARVDTAVGLAHIYLDDGSKLEAVEFKFDDRKAPLNYVCLRGLRAGLNKCLELSGKVQPMVYCPFENVHFFILKELAASKGAFYQELWSIINQFPGIDFAPPGESYDAIAALGFSYTDLYNLARDAWEAAADISKPAPNLSETLFDLNPLENVEFKKQIEIANAAASMGAPAFKFKDWENLKVPDGRDRFSRLSLDSLCKLLPITTVDFIRGQVANIYESIESKPETKGISTDDDRRRTIASALRWHLRGLSVKAALHKVSADAAVMLMARKEKS